MKKTWKGILGACVSISMLLGGTMPVTALNIGDWPDYQWVESPILYEEDLFVSDEDNPLDGHLTISTDLFYIIRTDMEEVTADTLGLPETADIQRLSNLNDFQQLSHSYLYRQNCYRVNGSDISEEWLEILMQHPEVDVVVQEYRSGFTPHGTLGVIFYTNEEVELTPEDFPDLMVDRVDNGSYSTEQSHVLFLSEESFKNGIDYNALYEALEENTEIEMTDLRKLCYQTIDDNGYYLSQETVTLRYQYTASKGDITALGDMNQNYDYDLQDATAILTQYAQTAAGLEHEESAYADVNQDGTVDITDATEVLLKYARAAAGLD